MPKIISANDRSIDEAARRLQDGLLVAFPTETVYGLGANALDGRAVAQIFEAKGRPQFNPLITHVPDLTAAEGLGEFSKEALELAAHYWPGPLTFIVKAKKGNGISDLVTAGLDTIALRVPRHETAQKLLKAAGVPVAAPSANRSGHLSPTSALHVKNSLGDKAPFILAAGTSRVGLESTVVDMSGKTPVLLRPGGITSEMLEEVLGTPIETDLHNDISPKSPGQLLKHYAPNAQLRLNAVDLEPGEALLAFGSIKVMGVRGGGAAGDLSGEMIRTLSESGELHEAAANLFSMLHDLDAQGVKRIAVMALPDTGLGMAINDRLRRAAER